MTAFRLFLTLFVGVVLAQTSTSRETLFTAIHLGAVGEVDDHLEQVLVLPREALGERVQRKVLRKAVKGMLPRNKLGRAQIGKLKIYAGPEHPHSAQGPEPMKLETR